MFKFYDGTINSVELWRADPLRYPEVVVTSQEQMAIVFYPYYLQNDTVLHIHWSAVPCKYKWLKKCTTNDPNRGPF